MLLAVGGLATVATQDTWLDGFGIIAYGLVPLAFIPLVAGAIASPRANRFVESVFTAPVERRDWLVAKVLVLGTLAGVYYLALVPMMAVYAHYVGVPFLLQRFLIWSAGLLVTSVAIGTLVGPAAAGYVFDATRSYSLVIAASIAGNLIAAGIMLAVSRRKGKV